MVEHHACGLTGAMTIDCLIIGGGLLGSATAFNLATEGLSVLLVEKGQINGVASSQNAGSLHFQLEYRMIENGADAARKAAEAMPLHLDAMARWGNVEAELGAPVGVKRTGGLMVAETSEQVAVLEQKAALERASGLDVELLDRSALDGLAPYLGPAVVAAAYCKGEGKADPKQTTLAFARSAIKAGAQIETGCEVQKLSRHGNVWHAKLQDGRLIQAKTVAITAGGWSGRVAAMAGMQMPVSPVGLTMTVTMRTKPLIPHLVQHAGRRLSLKQTPEGQVLIGGGWPAQLRHIGGVIDLDARPALQLTSLAGNMAAAASVVPKLEQLQVMRVWTGMTSLIADQLPLLGEIPKAPGLFIATGGSAFTLGLTYARLLADAICGKPPILDIRRFSPGRFGSLTLV
ncbi:NAD(P)/FAD-dependent oxidoreductase [Agrobacterium vaccinii]|uniref:NAD(P)/FAD-dependent oxidoreductase n=1 Tax=Agrobacterium vaccinii TaxID=2735528 RepID=UPI001E43A38E|nr:FAD-binding oxidoreductase [Agrobacterium vaccinii]